MRFTPVSGDPVTIENPTSDIGYHDTVGKILASTQEPAAVSLQERNFRIHTTTLSVELLHKAAYMFGTNYYQIPFGCNPAEIVPEPGRALTVEARTRELYRELEAMVEGVIAELRADEFLSTEVSLSRALLFETSAGAFGFLHVDPGERRVDLEFFEDSIDMRRSEVAAAVRAAAEKRGWAFGS